MIKTENITTTVSFAKEKNKGTISVQAHYNQLILQELSTEKKVSDVLETKDIKELPKVVCDFQTTESIDVMIAILERIKLNMVMPSDYNFSKAC